MGLGGMRLTCTFSICTNMTHFSNPRSRRSTSFVVLLVWLFAVASGIANACVLKTHEVHAHVVAAKPVEAAHAHSASAGHALNAADHQGDEVDISKAPCLKACDDGAQLLIKQQTSLHLGDSGSLFLVSILWTTAIPVATIPRQREGLQSAAHGPPVRVRYSRLTL